MPDARPPIFDDGGELPEVDRSRSRGGASGDTYDDDYTYHPDDRHPNFLVRRALVVGVVIAVIALGAVGVGQLLGGDDGGSTASGASEKWNTVVSIDRTSGTIVLTDTEGEETDRFRLGIQPLTDARVAGSTIIASSNSELAVVSLRDTEAITTIEIETNGLLLMPSGSAQTVIAHDASSERAIFVHGPTAEVIDTAELNTVAGARYDLELARSDPSGRNVLVTDAGNFQSVLFSFDRDEPSFFPGLALAVNDGLVVTAQNVGNDATIAVFDHAGEQTASQRTDSVRAGMLIGGGVVLVTVEGDVVTVPLAGGDPSTVGTVAVGTVHAGHVAVRGDRLIVVGEVGTAVIDDEGLVIADLVGTTPTTSGIDQLAPRRTACLIAQRDADGDVIVVDLTDGRVVAEALANPEVLAGVDGCSPVVPTSAGYLVVSADGVLRATITGDVVAVSPDGRTIVAENANRFEMLPTVDQDNETDDAEPIDIGRSGRLLFFADL